MLGDGGVLMIAGVASVGNGVNVSNESWFIDTANNVNVKTASTVNSNFDEFGRALTTTYLDGSTVTRTYGCCGVESEIDQNGTLTTYAYDEFKRICHTTRDGITTLYSYDDLGNQTAVTTKGRDDGEITTSSTYSNGELASTTDALGNVTTYARAYLTSGMETTYTETTTNPDGGTQITTSVNGQQTGISGTAVHPQTFEYGPNWQMTATPITADVSMTVKNYTDLLGRNYKTEYADGTYSMNYYNTKNQVVKSVSPGGVTTLYSYDALGRQTVQAIDMNANGEIDSADLVTATAYSYGTQDGKTVSITTQTRSQGDDSAVISVNKQSVDGLESWSTDLSGQTTHTKLERLGNGVTRQTVTNPDGTKVITNTANDKTTTVQQVNSDQSNGNLITYTYDEFDRVIQLVETFGATTVNTTTMTYNANGAVLTQTVNDQVTSFEYDNMGRQTKVTAPGNVVTNTAYYPTGEIQRIDGATYPVEYTYNGLGNQATMTTFKDADTPQQTSWSYNSRGQMIAKTYADNSSVTYTYNGDGQLLTRTWARQANGAPLVTSYTYDAAGRQIGYSYSDGTTPAVTQTLNFLDQPVTVTDAAGTRNFTYNADHRLVNETIPSIVNGMIDYTYDAYGRRTVMSFGNGTTSFANAAYSYDSAGRIATVGNDTHSANYAYTPAGMLHITTIKNLNDQAIVTTGRNYDVAHRLTGISTNGNSFTYTYNNKNQRVMQVLPDTNQWSYDYDNFGQVILGTKQTAQAQAIAGQQFSYSYDQIGNRMTAEQGSSSKSVSYASNIVNQYTAVNAAAPTYDADGNMLTCNGWTRQYDGENRLISEENGNDKFEYVYDYKSRRIETRHYEKGLLTLYDWSLQSTTRHIWDEWNIIADFIGNSEIFELNKAYLWGLDLTGSLTAAGGVGALISETNVEGVYFAVYDGNGNIAAYLTADGSIVAEYAYDPFLNVTASTGSTEDFVYQARFCSHY